MSQGAIIAGAFVMAICCSSSSAAMLMMGGDEEKTTTTTTTPTGPGPTGPPSPYSVRDAWTGANDWGEGNAVYLDRHTLDCGDDGLNEFKFVRPSTEQIEYSYKCLEGINSPADIVKDSGANDWGEGNAIFLDRHTVDCGTKPITKFRLGRPTPSEIRYDYTCNSKDVTGACRDVNTEWNDEGDGKSIYLDRHDVKCDAGEVITKFKLGRDGQGKYRYDYKCCKM
jgi:hypothetical protein